MHLLRCTSLLAILVFTGSHSAQSAAPEAADSLFARARAQARAEHKNVLMVFSASWCGPCKLYERFLEDPQMKPITEKAFIVQRVDVGERTGDTKHADTPGGTALRSALGAALEPGFPWIVITDPEGKPLISSYAHGDKSNNVGYPAIPSEIDWYVDMLKKTAPQLSSQDLATTRSWFQARAH